MKFSFYPFGARQVACRSFWEGIDQSADRSLEIVLRQAPIDAKANYGHLCFPIRSTEVGIDEACTHRLIDLIKHSKLQFAKFLPNRSPSLGWRIHSFTPTACRKGEGRRHQPCVLHKLDKFWPKGLRIVRPGQTLRSFYSHRQGRSMVRGKHLSTMRFRLERKLSYSQSVLLEAIRHCAGYVLVI